MCDSETTIGTKPRIIVLGTGEDLIVFVYLQIYVCIGWGAVSLLRHIDTQKYEVVCVSPRNYFLMTPLLPSVSVGTVETRTVIEAIRSLMGPRIKYIEASCVNVDLKAKVITCNTNEEKPASGDDDVKSVLASSKEGSGASSRVVNDSSKQDLLFLTF